MLAEQVSENPLNLDLLFKTLKEEGFSVLTKPHNGNNYYFFLLSETAKLVELREKRPEIFRGKSE